MQAKRRLITAVTVFLLAILAMYFAAKAQENQERLAHSNGQGTLRVGDEKFNINSVIVKLLPDRKAEVTLVSDITIFLTATWSNHTASPQEIDLDMTGSASRGGLEGAGKALLSNDGKAVARLNLKGISRATKRPVEVNFEGK